MDVIFFSALSAHSAASLEKALRRKMLLILRNPQFRLLWISTVFADMGLILGFMVLGWLALSVSDSAFWAGAVWGMEGAALMTFSAFGGVLVDRLDRRNLILSGQLAQAALALALAVLIFSGRIQLWHVLSAAFLEGMVASFKVPARMAITLDVVGREKLLTATAAGFASMTVMGIVAPLIGGSVVSGFGIGWAYVIMGAAFLTSSGILVLLRVAPRAEKSKSTPWQDLKQGVGYVLATPIVRALILLVLVTEVFGWAHESMLSVMARDALGVGASGLGYMLSAASAGGTVSTLIMSSVGNVEKKGRLLVAGVGGFGLFLVLFASSPWFPLSLVLLALAYGSAVAYEATLSTLLQTVVPDEMRGRVLSFQTFSWGLTGLSGFHMGAIASLLGAPVAIGIGGGVVVLNALRLLRRTPEFQEQPVEGVAGDG